MYVTNLHWSCLVVDFDRTDQITLYLYIFQIKNIGLFKFVKVKSKYH